MTRVPLLSRIAASLAVAALAWASACAADERGIAPEDLQSGYAFQSRDTQALQDDPFANPGLLWVDAGRELWRRPDGAANKACADCHDDMTGVAARYPRIDETAQSLVNLEQRINLCRVRHQEAEPFAYESEDLLSMTAFLASQSDGLAYDVEIDGAARPFFDAGRDYFYRRRGQLNLACSQCHDDNWGRMLRGDRLSQGHGNGHPAYRLEWQTIGSLQRRLRFCDTGVRAEPFAYGAPEYVALELFLAWRANGLPIEAPSVRR